ncbi:hypothetical protein ACH42_00525 [Endozoicomonas sp. (ex Bugula neritina AB1)]|nr:hypothetical protein ACH42_00525 [Endozoicomonas sp. (ex Bugula neritina AB1)]
MLFFRLIFTLLLITLSGFQGFRVSGFQGFRVSGCSLPKQTEVSVAGTTSLTEAQAHTRKTMVQKVGYELFLDLTNQSEI